MNTAMEICGLTVAYQQAPVLLNVSLRLPAGKLVAIVGPNGAGKTTLLKAMLGLLKPVSGTVRFALGDTGDNQKGRIGYVPQSESVDWDFPATVLDVVLMGRYGRLGWLRRPGRRDRELALQTLEKVGMADLAGRQIGRLSGGQRQRVFLARALAQQADIYLMDEPFQGVDAQTEKAIVRLLGEMRREGKTVVAVHHDLQTVTAYFDWIVFINRRVVAAGPAAEVFCEENLRTVYRPPGCPPEKED